jgi:hypothetical protein
LVSRVRRWGDETTTLHLQLHYNINLEALKNRMNRLASDQ